MESKRKVLKNKTTNIDENVVHEFMHMAKELGQMVNCLKITIIFLQTKKKLHCRKLYSKLVTHRIDW